MFHWECVMGGYGKRLGGNVSESLKGFKEVVRSLVAFNQTIREAVKERVEMFLNDRGKGILALR